MAANCILSLFGVFQQPKEQLYGSCRLHDTHFLRIVLEKQSCPACIVGMQDDVLDNDCNFVHISVVNLFEHYYTLFLTNDCFLFELESCELTMVVIPASTDEISQTQFVVLVLTQDDQLLLCSTDEGRVFEGVEEGFD